jgi:transposase
MRLVQTSAAHSILTTDVAALQRLVLEQREMIETLKEQLHRALRREFGPRHEAIDIDQLALFAAKADDSRVIELAVVDSERAGKSSEAAEPSISPPAPKRRRQAIRILKDLTREVRIVDIPEDQKVCGCCGGALHHFADESSEQLAYVPASIKIIETRRKKYACKGCHGEIKRAALPTSSPMQKGMAGASLLAFLIVTKFADGLPLYRIAQRLERLGVDLSHTLMSAWLMQCAPLLEALRDRILKKVLDGGHVFTDDTILPLQNHDPARRSTVQSRLWVYGRHQRRSRPLVAYEFTRSRSREGPLAHLKDFRGYLQADAFPGYDPLYANVHIREVGCWAHARRKFVEVAELMKTGGRAHEALGFIRALYRIERQSRLLNDAERQEVRQRRAVPVLAAFKNWLDAQAHTVLPQSSLGAAVQYALKNWTALTRYTEAGYLEADNNFAERCLRPVAVGRKAFLFVGSERAGHAAAIYYSLIESCKLNQVNPLAYLTYVLEHARDKSVTLPTPDEFSAAPQALAQIG